MRVAIQIVYFISVIAAANATWFGKPLPKAPIPNEADSLFNPDTFWSYYLVVHSDLDTVYPDHLLPNSVSKVLSMDKKQRDKLMDQYEWADFEDEFRLISAKYRRYAPPTNILDGAAHTIWGTIVGLYNLVRHPIQSAKHVVFAATHPLLTLNAFKSQVEKSTSENGLSYTLGEAAAFIGTSVLPLSAGSVAARATSKIASAVNGVETAGAIGATSGALKAAVDLSRTSSVASLASEAAVASKLSRASSVADLAADVSVAAKTASATANIENAITAASSSGKLSGKIKPFLKGTGVADTVGLVVDGADTVSNVVEASKTAQDLHLKETYKEMLDNELIKEAERKLAPIDSKKK